MTIAVIVSTFGDPTWTKLAAARAIPSATAQAGPAHDILYNHGDTLAAARNTGAQQTGADWLCFLDADDELEPGYLHAMEQEIDGLAPGDWLLQPATRGVVDGHVEPVATVIPRRRLIDGNYLIIGTLVRRQQFLRVGGFHEWDCYEDWDLWLRCWLDGAESTPVPEAIYRVHIRADSRNNGERSQQIDLYNQIRNTHLADVTQARR